MDDVARWVGVVLAIVGTIVTAPDGTRRVVGECSRWLHHQARRVHGQLARWVPWLRRSQVVKVATVAGSASVSGALSARVSGFGWDPSRPVDERIEKLRTQVLRLYDEIGRLDQGLREEKDARQRAVGELGQALRAEIRQLTDRIDEQENKASEIDARGLPVLTLGIVIGGLSEEIGRIPLWLAVVLLAGACFYALRRVRLTFRPQARTETGS